MKALALLGEINEQWVQIDVGSFSAAIGACEKGKQWIKAPTLQGSHISFPPSLPPEAQRLNAQPES